MSRVRRGAYRLGVVLGDVEAARRGPAALGRRLVRKGVYRAEGRWTRKVLRQIGLGR